MQLAVEDLKKIGDIISGRINSVRDERQVKGLDATERAALVKEYEVLLHRVRRVERDTAADDV